MATFLSIILLILKIIGILLLLILALFCIILLVPIRYGFELSAPEGEEISAEADIGWLLRLINGRFRYLEKNLSYDVKILGFRLISNDPAYIEKKKQKESDKEKKKQKKKSPPKEEEIKSNEVSEEAEEPKSTEIPEIAEESKPAEVPERPEETLPSVEYHPSRNYADEKKAIREEQQDQKEEKIPVSERIASVLEKIRGVGSKISDGIDRVVNLKDTLEEYEIMKLLEIGKDTLLAVLHHILPYSLKGWVRYGFDDPSLTGYVAALGAVFYPRYYKDFSLEPDFQRVCFAGYCKGRGRIRLGFFVLILIKLLLKKEVRRLLHLLLK